MRQTTVVKKLIEASRTLAAQASRLKFAPPVFHVYNPLVYAREPWENYLDRYAGKKAPVVLLGMNPGPFGMAQTGVPFGEVQAVKQWLGIKGRVRRPKTQHPKRPIEGFSCTRSEVSGKRVWAWAQERFSTPTKFFEHFFILNYCPLVFMGESGKNITPDKLHSEEKKKLFSICDRALRSSVEALEPKFVLGVGAFAHSRINSALAGMKVKTGRILHPSPASPLANKGWAERAEKDLREVGIIL